MAYYLKNRRREPDLSINAATASGTAQLKAGEYTVYCKDLVDCFICTGAAWESGNSLRLLAGNMIEVTVEENDKILAKSETGAATLEICKVL